MAVSVIHSAIGLWTVFAPTAFKVCCALSRPSCSGLFQVPFPLEQKGQQGRPRRGHAVPVDGDRDGYESGMRTVIIDAFDQSGSVREIPEPQVEPDSILIRVTAAVVLYVG